jgi:DNA polymerase III delta subunit
MFLIQKPIGECQRVFLFFLIYNRTTMVIALFGSDSYRRIEKGKELVRAYRAKYPLADLLSVDLEEDPESWVSARDFLRQPSMFVDSKVLLVREPAAAEDKEWSEALKDAASAKGVVAILSSEKDATANFPFLDHKGVERQEFKELEGRILEVFVAREAKARGIAFDPIALRFFLNYLETFPSRGARAIAELDKMTLAKFRSPVTREDMEELTAWLPSEELYRGARTVCEGKSAFERLTALERLFLAREAAAKLFNTIGYLATGAPAAALGAYDIAAKSGKLEYEEALTDFAIAPSGSPAVTRAEVFLRDVI